MANARVAVTWTVIVAALILPTVLAAITITTTSTPTVTVKDTYPTWEDRGVSGCAVQLNADATVADVTVTVSGIPSSMDNCPHFANPWGTLQYKIRCDPDVTNIARITDFRILTDSPAILHVQIDSGVMTQTESTSWNTIQQNRPIKLRDEVTSGDASVMTCEFVLADDSGRVKTVYDLTYTLAAT